MIVPLTDDPAEAGGTHFQALGSVVNRFGKILAFRGDVWHHGAANEHPGHTRCFLYFVLSNARSDPNLMHDL